MLKDRIRAREPLVGTFLKTPHYGVVEALGGTGLDFVILDGEHAGFGLAQMDACVLAARAVGLPCLARITSGTPADILRVLDLGADGIFVPHVMTGEQAAAIAKAAHYGAGGRGYAASNRAGNFGRVPMKQHLQNAKNVIVVAQIEDPEGVDNASAIAAVDGIDACFVGVADLAVAYEVYDLKADKVQAAIDTVVSACADKAMSVSSFAPDMAGVKALTDRGVTMVAVGSEHKAMQDWFSKAAVDAAMGRA